MNGALFTDKLIHYMMNLFSENEMQSSAIEIHKRAINIEEFLKIEIMHERIKEIPKRLRELRSNVIEYKEKDDFELNYQFREINNDLKSVTKVINKKFSKFNKN